VLFLAAGVICGDSLLGVLSFNPDQPVVARLAEFPLCSVLFTDGMRLGLHFFAATSLYVPLHAFAIGLLVLAVTVLTHVNEFLAAFVAGVTVATVGQQMREAFLAFGELVTELLKLAALLIFGALVSFEFVHSEVWLGEYLFAALVLLGVRPVALSLALLGSGLNWREWLTVAWFGPKGFASVVFGLMIWKSVAPRAEQLFHLVALVIVASIVMHSSTDVMIARWFHTDEAQPRATDHAPVQDRNTL
jgi:NhaP-type Na+/H+ and K+/H+ antiporter